MFGPVNYAPPVIVGLRRKPDIYMKNHVFYQQKARIKGTNESVRHKDATLSSPTIKSLVSYLEYDLVS